MDNRDLRANLLVTPFFSSFVDVARPGERRVGVLAARAAAWTAWAISNTVEMSGFSDRTYPAILLDGAFYDPRGRGPHVRPHLEIPGRVLHHADREFPLRLGLIGNTLAFDWWVVNEVKAAKRALFNTTGGSIAGCAALLDGARDPLAAALESLMSVGSGQWDVIEALLVTREEGLAAATADDFSTDEVARYFPAGADLHLRVSFDSPLRADDGWWVSRRMGAWQISGVAGDDSFSFGVLTPRLTAKSLFRDPQFATSGESPAALLVRGLVLDRVIRRYLNDEMLVAVAAARDESKPNGPKLRTIVAQVGQKMPEASLESAVHFLQRHPTAEAAWEAIVTLARHQGTLLTVEHDGYVGAYNNALRYLRRAEDPERDDINVILPIGWDDKSRPVRFTFSRPGVEG